MSLNNNQQPSQHPSQLQNISQHTSGSAASGRQHLRLGDGKQSSQSSSGNGRTHRAILSQGNELQMQYPNAMPHGGIAHGSADNEDGPMLGAPQASSDLNKTHQNNILLGAQAFSQGAARKGQAQLNSSRPNVLHAASFLDSKNIIAPQQPDQLGQPAGISAQGVARLTNNQNWMQGPNYNNAPPSQGGTNDPSGAVTQKSLSQQTQREATMQSREEEQPQNNPMGQAEGTNLPMPHQNPQFVRSLGRGSHPLGVGSVNSNSTATMTVATALSVHNSSDRQASLPVAKQGAPQPAALTAYQQPGPPPPQKQPYQHILQQNQQKDLQYADNGPLLNPLKSNHIPQSSGRMKEPSVAGSSVIGSEALSRISGHAGLANGSKANGIKESRSPQMVMSTLLYAPGSDVHNHLNDTHNSGNAFPNLGGVPSTNQSLQHKTPQIQLPSLLQNGAAANVTQGQASNSVSKAKSYQRAGVNYTYSHMKSPSASQADRDPYADRRNIQTGSLFQIRNKTTHSSINSGRKQIFSKSYATREQIGHASGSAGFANMTRSIEIHEVTNSVERDRRESAESVEGNFFPEPMDADIKGRYEQNSRERRLRSLGGKPLSSDNYEITTQSQNDRINRLMSKKTSLPLENNVNHNNVLSTANSEQLPTLSPNRQTTKHAQVAGSAHLNNILSTLKKPAIVNGIITDHENINKSVSPNYPLKQSLQQQKTIPIYANNGLSQTPVAAGPQNNALAMPGPNPHGQTQGPPQPFKPNAIKLTQARPPQAPIAQHLTMPVVAQNQPALPLPPSQQAQQPQPQDTTKLQLPGQAEDAAAAQKTFDFHYVKILLRQSSSHSHSTSQKKGASAGKTDGHGEGKQETFKEILLEREWLKKNRGAIPHFSEVISKVKETEGVEITMNCNSDAFYWLIDIVKIQTNYTFEFVKKDENGEPIEEMSAKERDFRVQEKFFEITPENCLNKLVTSHFLQIKWIYEQIWQQFFLDNFPAVINSCKISLSNLNSEIVAHIAERVSDGQLEKLKDRRDKFLSNLYRARIEQKLLRYCSSKRAFQITDHSIFYCEDCQKILTLKQSRRISCKLEGNEDRAFVDANGDLFVAHKFCDLNLQTDNYRINQSFAPATNSTTPPPGQQAPIDMAQFIRFFRERYRLCWKEIYLKFASISRNYEPEFCTKCSRWFRFCDFVGCPVGSDPSYGYSYESHDQQILVFHTVDHKTSLNNVTPEDILNYKRQIQVINDLYPQKDIEKMMKVMKERDKMKFVEPQSMNFEKKLSEAYLDFKVAMDKKAARQRTEKEPKPRELPVVENEFEDLLFQGAQAQPTIQWQLRGEPDLLKKFQKDAKAYVRDHPQGQNQQAVVDKLGECELDGYSGSYDKMESAQGKRKLSPRSMMRVNKLVRKRIVALKRETVTDDDSKSMNLLIQSLRMQRTEAESKKDKSMKKDKTLLLNGLLEEKQSNDRTKDLLTDIKIVKNQQMALQQAEKQKKAGKVLSDISQITQQQKKRNKKQNQNSFSALCQQQAAQSQSKPPTNPSQHHTSKGDKESTTANKEKEHSTRGQAGQHSSREKPVQSQHHQHQNQHQQQHQQPHQQNPMEVTPHTSTTQSSQRHAQITVPVRDQQHQLHQGNYHLHIWDARDKFKHLPQQPQHNIQNYQNGRSNSQNPSQLKVHNTSQQHAANIARSNSICSNERGKSTIQPQQFQFQHLQQKKDSSHNVNVNGTSIYPRQKSSQASSKNIVGRSNPSSFNVDQ